MAALKAEAPDLVARLRRLNKFSRTVRTAEYHVTNACNLRCKGCWFYEYAFDRRAHEVDDLEAWRQFAEKQASEGVTHSLLIGGEPTLFMDRIEAFVRAFRYVTVSTNGLRPIPRDGYDRVAIAITLFGGGTIDDELRGIRPSGKRFTGLLPEILKHYKDDQRATFVLALAPSSISSLGETVERIRDNGNLVTFNYYSAHGTGNPLGATSHTGLLEQALRIRDDYPETVVSDEYFIKVLITGSTEFCDFGYRVCPSISIKHPAHAERLKQGGAVLPGFNVYAADLETVQFCCTSGHCESCRDSQAIHSWLLLAFKEFLDTPERLGKWLDVAESFWRQFVWSPFHRNAFRGD